MKRRCFVCRKKLEGTISGTEEQRFDEAPAAATCWTTRGNFGSQVVDMLPGSPWTLEISICDECLSKGRKLVQQYRKETKTHVKHMPWEGPP